MIEEVKEAYEAGKEHERERIIELLKELDMEEFMAQNSFLHYDFHKWLDALCTKDVGGSDE